MHFYLEVLLMNVGLNVSYSKFKNLTFFYIFPHPIRNWILRHGQYTSVCSTHASCYSFRFSPYWGRCLQVQISVEFEFQLTLHEKWWPRARKSNHWILIHWLSKWAYVIFGLRFESQVCNNFYLNFWFIQDRAQVAVYYYLEFWFLHPFSWFWSLEFLSTRKEINPNKVGQSDQWWGLLMTV